MLSGEQTGRRKLVQLNLSPLSGALTDKLTELDHHGIGDVVIDGGPFPSPADETRLVHHLEVFGDVWLLAIDVLRQFTNGLFSGLQHLEQPQTKWLTEHLKSPSNEGYHFVTLRKRLCHRFTISRYWNTIFKVENLMRNSVRRWIDVREPSEFARGHIEGSELVPLARLSRECAGWDKHQPITLVCRSGGRAGRAQAQMTAKGFTNVHVLPGGVEEWRSKGNRLIAVAGGDRSSGSRSTLILYGPIAILFLGLAHYLSLWFLVVPALVGTKLALSR